MNPQRQEAEWCEALDVMRHRSYLCADMECTKESCQYLRNKTEFKPVQRRFKYTREWREVHVPKSMTCKEIMEKFGVAESTAFKYRRTGIGRERIAHGEPKVNNGAITDLK